MRIRIEPSVDEKATTIIGTFQTKISRWYRYLAQPIALISILLGASIAFAQNVAPLKLQFVDANDQAIDGVEISLQSLVYTGNTGLSLAVDDLKTVEGGRLAVDAEGKVTIAIPDAGLGDLARFRLNAKHPSFAEFNDWVKVDTNQLNKISLSRGVRIAVTAVDADSGERLGGNLYAIAEQKDLNRMVDWKSNGKGLLISRPLRDTDKRIRLVELSEGKALRFSEPIDIPPEVTKSTVESDVPMKPSLAFNGRLHPEVPRPIRNGMISVCVTWPTEEELQASGPIGHWIAHSPIAEDGSFRANGLPSGEWIQVIASCDGWYNEPAKAETRQRVCPSENEWLNIEESILPNIFEFQSSIVEAVLPMLRTTSTSIQFLDENGTPLAGMTFLAKRDQRFFHSSWDSREFRSERSTADELIAIRKGETYHAKSAEPIKGKTDRDGVAKIEGIPGTQFAIRIEGMLFGKGRLWKPINLDDPNDRQVKVSRQRN